MSGFIKLSRNMLEWEWYQDANTMRVWMHLLLRANYKPSRYQGHEIPCGSIVCSYDTLAADLGISKQQARTAISKLKTTSEITVKLGNKFQIISIVKWDEYQGGQHADNTQSTRNQHAVNTQVTPSKEGKKERREEDRGNLHSPKKQKSIRLESFLAEHGEQTVSKRWGEWALREGLSVVEIDHELGQIRDWSRSSPKGAKLDWDATWRTWVRKAVSNKRERERKDEIFRKRFSR